MAGLLNHRYRILRSLAEGGFGKTFLAEDIQMPSRRRCVIKQLKSASSEPGIAQIVRDRFAREAAVLESVSKGNPQIPDLYAYFSEGNQFYLIQEWVEGTPLHQTIPPTWSEESVVKFLTDVLPALDLVHQQNIVHRDIKPENIILRQRDRLPCLIDFGAVKEMISTVVSAGTRESSIVIGTPGFMPPEQAAGRPTFASDLYSLSMTAIYLLTGRSPHEISTDSYTGQVLWQQYANGMSDRTAAILTRAISLNPQDRYPTAADMLSALSQASEYKAQIAETVVSAQPSLLSARVLDADPKQKTRISWRYAGIGSGVLAVVALIWGGSQIQRLTVERSQSPTENSSTVTIERNQKQQPLAEGDSIAELTASIESIEKTITEGSDAFDKGALAINYLDRAEKLYAEGRESRALTDINSAVMYDSTLADAFVLRGDIYANQSRPDFEGAIAAYTEALNTPELLDPIAARIFGKRCQTYVKLENWALAEENCTRSLNLNGTNAGIYAVRGDIYAAQNELEQANEQYSIAIEINEESGVDDRSVYYRRSQVREKMGDAEGALSDLQYIRTPQ